MSCVVCGVQAPPVARSLEKCRVMLQAQQGLGSQFAGVCRRVQLPRPLRGGKPTVDSTGGTASAAPAPLEQFWGAPFCAQPSPRVLGQ